MAYFVGSPSPQRIVYPVVLSTRKQGQNAEPPVAYSVRGEDNGSVQGGEGARDDFELRATQSWISACDR